MIAWRALDFARPNDERHLDTRLGGWRRTVAGDEHGDRVLHPGLFAFGGVGADDPSGGDLVALLRDRLDDPEPGRFERPASVLQRHPGNVGHHRRVGGRVDEQLDPLARRHHRAGTRIGSVDDPVLELVVLLLGHHIGEVP